MGRQSAVSTISRISDSKSPNIRLFLIAEGKTEIDYFYGIKKNHMLKNYVVLDIYRKEGIDLDETDRSKLIDLANDYMEKYRVHKLKLYTYITVILNDYFLSKYPEYYREKNESSKKLYDSLREFRTCLFKKYSTIAYSFKGFVNDPMNLYYDIVADLNREYDESYTFNNTDSFVVSQYIKPDDEVYVIFDRDFDEVWRNDSMYKGYIEKCREYGYTPIVSTPQFELWLLMHFQNVDFKNPSYKKYYGQYIMDELKKYDIGTKSQMKERFDIHYKDKIEQAIKCSTTNELFTTDVDELCNHAGTNMGLFIQKIISLDNN